MIALAPRRSQRLHVLRKHADREPRPRFMPLAGLPAGGRDECRDGERPCRYVHCEHHLWLVDGRDRPGRRWNGRELPSMLYARWLERPQPPSCELDVTEKALLDDALLNDQGLVKLEVIAEAIGVTTDWAGRIVAKALFKLKASGGAETLRGREKGKR